MVEEPEGWWDDLIYTSNPDEDNQIWVTVDPYGMSKVVGSCANCGQYIFEGEGQGGTTVHDACAREFTAHLITAYY